LKPAFIKGALFLRRNLIALIAAFVVMNISINNLPLFAMLQGADSWAVNTMLLPSAMYGVPLAIYAAFVVQSLFSRDFKTNFEQREIINEIKKSSEECHQSARNLRRRLEPNAQARLSTMLKESDEIVHSFLNGDKNYLKVRTVQQSLKLMSAYVKLADMFRVRASASSGERISQLAKRINANTGNMNSVKDPGIADELKRVIAADERMIESLKNERLELERIDARLQYMESTIGMLKYNIISNLESEDFLHNLESDVLEADALNSVLNDRYDERREINRLRL